MAKKIIVFRQVSNANLVRYVSFIYDECHECGI